MKFYIPVKHRYKNKLGEIDLICYKKSTLIFFEIKARYEIYEFDTIVSPYQVKRIKASAINFINNNSLYKNCNIRFDFIFFSLKKLSLLHIKNIQ